MLNLSCSYQIAIISVTMEKYGEESYTVELEYIGSLPIAKFIRYIRNTIYTRNFLFICTMGTENFIRYIRLSDINKSDIFEFYCSLSFKSFFRMSDGSLYFGKVIPSFKSSAHSSQKTRNPKQTNVFLAISTVVCSFGKPSTHTGNRIKTFFRETNTVCFAKPFAKQTNNYVLLSWNREQPWRKLKKRFCFVFRVFLTAVC